MSIKKPKANEKLKILCVDDARCMLQTLTIILRDEYEVLILEKATHVESFLKNTAPDLFLIDYKMPDINGFELIPIIRKFDRHKNTPIIIVTSESTAECVKEAISLGACDFISKPVQAALLKEKVAKHIKK